MALFGLFELRAGKKCVNYLLYLDSEVSNVLVSAIIRMSQVEVYTSLLQELRFCYLF